MVLRHTHPPSFLRAHSDGAKEAALRKRMFDALPCNLGALKHEHTLSPAPPPGPARAVIASPSLSSHDSSPSPPHGPVRFITADPDHSMPTSVAHKLR